MTELPTVSPHDLRVTAAQLARHLDDVVRALNYATRPGDPRLGNVPDAYCILGALREALAKLPQARTQIAVGLHRHEGTGQLRAEQGWPHASHPREAIVHAAALLGDASDAIAAAGHALGQAQSAISGLSHDFAGQSTTHTAAPNRSPAAQHSAVGADSGRRGLGV